MGLENLRIPCLVKLEQELKLAQETAQRFLRQRIELVSEIDRTEAAWKKKKREMQGEMGRLLNQYQVAHDNCTVIQQRLTSERGTKT